MNIVKLTPAYKSIIWGGEKLKREYGKETELSPLAESWELAFHKDGKCTLPDGRALCDVATAAELGKNCEGFPFFPVLVKFIDACDKLSVQVHPADEYALKHENSLGKTEMWYIVDAEEGAGIYLGFRESITKEEFKRAIEEKTLTDYLKFIPVKAGESYFIPSGTIHAICSGCLICEIQQNSNITYRVFDYGRRDKNGNERELHIEKAIDVTNTEKLTPCELNLPTKEGLLKGINRFFTATYIEVNGTRRIEKDGASFRCYTCLEGAGCVGNVEIKKGESVFVPADLEKFELKGSFKAIMTTIRKYYIGIDLGGTFIKGGIVNDLGEIILSDKVPTETDKGADAVVANIAALAKSLLERCGLTTADIEGLGIGSPGMIDGAEGNVVYANNLGWENFKIGNVLSSLLGGIKVKIGNDANVATLGEVRFGAARDHKSAIMLTLGTGVGGGIVLDGKLVEGNRGAGAELGHIVVEKDGVQCSCGRRGCLEAYASATALIRETKCAMAAHPDSAMWEIGDIDAVTGKTVFDYAGSDPYAKEVLDNYIAYLACGLTNYANVFRPEVILLGGGVCAQGDNLIVPLQKKLNEELYAGDKGPAVPILIAELENRAGLLGAAALLMD